ncbi:MAG: VanZ family protein [Clostridia bacterium]|nr:VanZ family protein [Clostridia bacterium]
MKVRAGIFAAFAVLTMICIFILSSQTLYESNNFSNRLTNAIVNLLEPDLHGENAEKAKEKAENEAGEAEKSVEASAAEGEKLPEEILNRAESSYGEEVVDKLIIPKKRWLGIHPLRFSSMVRKAAHFILFMLLGLFFCLALSSFLSKHNVFTFLISLAFCALYAGIDEFHQLFVEGRGAEFLDVLIDVAGALLGILIATLIYYLRSKIKKRKEKKI